MPVTFSSKHAAAQLYPVLKIAGDADHRPPVALDKPVCVVGRRWGVNLSLTAQTVSNLHALIVRERNRVYIRDLASRNRVFVNGQPVRETDLAPGDVVAVGPYELRCDAGFTDRRTDAAAAPPRAPTAALELDPTGGARMPLDHRAVLIGRRPDCDLALPRDPDVFPVHAVVFELDGKRFLRDLTGTHGTRVNGRAIHQQELHEGDELRIGRATIRYTTDAAPTPQLPEDELSPEFDIFAPAEDGDSDGVEEDALVAVVSEPAHEEIEDDPDAPLPVETESSMDEIEPVEPPAVDQREDEESIPVAADPEPPALAPTNLDAPTAPEVLAQPTSEDDNDDEPAVPENLLTEPEPTDAPEPMAVADFIEEPSAASPTPDDDETPLMHTPSRGNGDHDDRPPDQPDDGRDSDPDSPDDGPARKLDKIVSELADRVADLETTWEEVKDKQRPDR